MSASPVARQATQSQLIPSRHVVISGDASLPSGYSTTPGGTMFSTTPGGTRIVYERQALMQLRNSPMAKTPPRNIQYFPGMMKSNVNKKETTAADERNRSTAPQPPVQTSVQTQQQLAEEQFQMDL